VFLLERAHRLISEKDREYLELKAAAAKLVRSVVSGSDPHRGGWSLARGARKGRKLGTPLKGGEGVDTESASSQSINHSMS
jgi:hypothetical protein